MLSNIDYPFAERCSQFKAFEDSRSVRAAKRESPAAREQAKSSQASWERQRNQTAGGKRVTTLRLSLVRISSPASSAASSVRGSCPCRSPARDCRAGSTCLRERKCIKRASAVDVLKDAKTVFVGEGVAVGSEEKVRSARLRAHHAQLRHSG